MTVGKFDFMKLGNGLQGTNQKEIQYLKKYDS